MNDNVLHRIRNGMDGFSKGQKRIANYNADGHNKYCK